jgi:hypothetical protein
MSQIQHSYTSIERTTFIRLHDPKLSTPKLARWRINGHRTCLLIWSADEWDRLTERPPDAQYHPFGFWCALRVE